MLFFHRSFVLPVGGVFGAISSLECVFEKASYPVAGLVKAMAGFLAKAS
jgi:hypothetical protein